MTNKEKEIKTFFANFGNCDDPITSEWIEQAEKMLFDGKELLKK